jgi:hypothetical protein
LKTPNDWTTFYVGEIVKVNSTGVSGVDLNNPTTMSSDLRSGGCKAVLVPVDYEYSHAGVDALKLAVKEQARFKSDDIHSQVTSRIPVITRVPAIDPLQLAQVALEGAVAVIIPMSLAGAEKTRTLMASAEDLGLETLIRVTSAEELATALEFGAKIIVFGDMNRLEAAALKESVPADVVTVADIPFEDVVGAWKFRDSPNFDVLIAGQSLAKICIQQEFPPPSVLKSLKRKGSSSWGLGEFDRQDGSKEKLGTILM